LKGEKKSSQIHETRNVWGEEKEKGHKDRVCGQNSKSIPS